MEVFSYLLLLNHENLGLERNSRNSLAYFLSRGSLSFDIILKS